MKAPFLLFILCFCFIQTFYAQEDDGVVSLDIPSRNSLTFNRFTINPTFSFVREQTKYISFYNKREWVQFENAPLTYLASYSGRFGENIGAGLGVFQQNYGVLTTFGGLLNFAYNAQVGRDKNLTFGINIGAYKSGVNTANVVTNFDDPSLQNVPENFLLTINPGINYGTEFLDFGLSINNLALYNFTSSALIEDDPQQSIEAHLMYTGYMSSRGFFDNSKFTSLIRSEFQKDETIISGVVMVTVPKGIWAQAGYNTLYGASGGVGINITTQIAIEYNYEKALGDIDVFGSAHEITLAYRFKNNNYYYYSREDEVSSILSNGNKRRRVSKTSKSKVAATNTSNKSKIDTQAATQAKLAAEQKAKAEADEQAKILEAEQKAQQEAEAQKAQELAEVQAELDKIEADKKAEEIAATRARIQAEQEAKAQQLAEQKAKEETEAKALQLAEQKAKEEAEAKALQLAEQKAKEEAEAKALQLAEQKAKEEAEAKALQLAEQKAKEEAEAKALQLAEQKAKEEAEAKALQLTEQKAKEEAEAKALQLAEQKAKEETEAQAKLLADQKAKEEAEAQAKLLAEQKAKEDAIANPKDELAKSMLHITKVTEDSKVLQGQLFKQFKEIVDIKNQDLKDLKKENNLSNQGITVQPKPFKSVTAENNKLNGIIADLEEVTLSQNEKIDELTQLYEERASNKEYALDEITLFYKNEIKRLKSEQLKFNNLKNELVAELEAIKTAIEIERRKRIKRAAYNSEEDRYSHDRAVLKNIIQTTKLSETPLKAEDFDFGETLGNNIKILKNIDKVKSGYYLIIAVHSDTERRNEFVTKMVASGRSDVDFFHDVSTSKYYIFYDKFDDIGSANKALESKGNRPYNGKMSIVKIEN
ncbi:PorP/SprF family type IX secretion system membrane protein [Winogradskyella vidalii]|uniref:PorP/SprF family type IX secretion system membrane protein n=1 Tax=Winogradskyella vidalii TaxID=2615024 RepID=UPI0015C7B2E0|nr:PorP/SprF family type IX secretion system membrane protein [Winogradskyella vidalii]